MCDGLTSRINAYSGLLLGCVCYSYAHILSGTPRAKPAPIVDFVPVGYDLDLLEVCDFALPCSFLNVGKGVVCTFSHQFGDERGMFAWEWEVFAAGRCASYCTCCLVAAPLCSILDSLPPPSTNPLCQVRLLELYDIVDLFVLYEIPYTHMGMEKPLYFNDSLTSE
jgi:hypothetical protein